MLVTFEGQDGAGKTTLLLATAAALTAQGVYNVVVREFSTASTGRRLLDALSRDKFLRPAPDEDATHLTRALDVIADLLYQDEAEVSPALASGAVVLKDRHVDTVLSTQAVALTNHGWAVPQALQWLEQVCSALAHRPDLTVHVQAPLAVRLDRLRHRARDLTEDRANDVDENDVVIFDSRDAVMRDLTAREPGRFVLVPNGEAAIELGTERILRAIQGRGIPATVAREGDRPAALTRAVDRSRGARTRQVVA